MLNRYYKNTLGIIKSKEAILLLNEVNQSSSQIIDHYENRNYSKALNEIRSIAEKGNKYFDSFKPWDLIKNPNEKENVHQILTVSLNLFRKIAIFLMPVLPSYVEEVSKIFNENADDYLWSTIDINLEKNKD